MARNEIVMSLDQAEEYVSKTPAARWDGWSIVMFSPNRAAWTKRDGRFHNGTWGFETRIGVSKDGAYRLPMRFARADK
jgi:hypothetical protein